MFRRSSGILFSECCWLFAFLLVFSACCVLYLWYQRSKAMTKDKNLFLTHHCGVDECIPCIKIVTVREICDQNKAICIYLLREVRPQKDVCTCMECEPAGWLDTVASLICLLQSPVCQFSSLFRWPTDTRLRCPPTASHSVQIHRSVHHHHVCQPFIAFTSLHSLLSISHWPYIVS